jgi:hypothetical protein
MSVCSAVQAARSKSRGCFSILKFERIHGENAQCFSPERRPEIHVA